jgi:anti-sigma B factor antagonist
MGDPVGAAHGEPAQQRRQVLAARSHAGIVPLGGDNRPPQGRLRGVELKIGTRADGERMVVGVIGEVDVYTAPTLRDHLSHLVADGHYHLILDLEEVAFLDSTGLGVLVGGLKRVRAHDGSLALVCTQERILKVFRITGLTKVFRIHASVPEALAAEPV